MKGIILASLMCLSSTLFAAADDPAGFDRKQAAYVANQLEEVYQEFSTLISSDQQLAQEVTKALYTVSDLNAGLTGDWLYKSVKDLESEYWTKNWNSVKVNFSASPLATDVNVKAKFDDLLRTSQKLHGLFQSAQPIPPEWACTAIDNYYREVHTSVLPTNQIVLGHAGLGNYENEAAQNSIISCLQYHIQCHVNWCGQRQPNHSGYGK